MSISEEKLKKVIQLLNEVILYLKMNDDSKDLIDLQDLTNLKKMLKSNLWPNALSEEELKESKEEKVKNVLKNITNIENMDIACFADDADIFVKEIIKAKANKVVCFSLDKNINPFKIEESNQIGIVTNNKNELVGNGPFDIIICYDFLEHTGESPENWLSLMKSIRKTNGPIYLRAHPFTSRYHDHNLANKAYSHLVFTDSEKLKIGCPSGKKPCKELLTENEYFKLFYSLELSIIERNIIDHPIEEEMFIKNSMISEKIKATLNKEMLFAEELSFEYIDYLLA